MIVNECAGRSFGASGDKLVSGTDVFIDPPALGIVQAGCRFALSYRVRMKDGGGELRQDVVMLSEGDKLLILSAKSVSATAGNTPIAPAVIQQLTDRVLNRTLACG